jgi:putative IMPACT (imprinted ancient) family translation regulator
MPSPSEQIIQITPSGTRTKRLDINHLHIDFKILVRWGKNIIDVEFHAVSTALNSRSHLIRFRNGGEVMFAWEDKVTLKTWLRQE